ncbi:MAG: hypothetical protein C0614_05065 [Desulfuromonas sp.]|nr:MAG: hypothetical protein C0614_05065 [Desulfuromonas sp.]
MSKMSRQKAEIRVYYGPTQKAIVYDFSADISTGGIYLCTKIPFKIDQRLTLHFSLPGKATSVNCKARVAWVNQVNNLSKPEFPQGIGVEFLDLPAEELYSISAYLDMNERGNDSSY